MDFKVNSSYKLDYLRYIYKEYSEENRHVSEYIVKAIDDFESLVNAKVYNFNKDNMLALLGSFNCAEISTLIIYKSFIRYYLVHVSDKTSGIGMASIDAITSEDLETVINKKKRDSKYLSKKEYIEFLQECDGKLNSQDAVLFVLLWHGVKAKGYEDLRTIRVNAFDPENNTLTHNGRVMDLTPLERKIIYDAITEKEYHKYEKKIPKTREEIDEETGEVKVIRPQGKAPVNEYSLSANCPYIVKPITTVDEDIESLYNTKLRLLWSMKHMQ
ncbi:MAG: hypothetical protein ACRDD7_09485, partial [Peptostreptococcaceae bacterium]